MSKSGGIKSKERIERLQKTCDEAPKFKTKKGDTVEERCDGVVNEYIELTAEVDEVEKLIGKAGQSEAFRYSPVIGIWTSILEEAKKHLKVAGDEIDPKVSGREKIGLIRKLNSADKEIKLARAKIEEARPNQPEPLSQSNAVLEAIGQLRRRIVAAIDSVFNPPIDPKAPRESYLEPVEGELPYSSIVNGRLYPEEAIGIFARIEIDGVHYAVFSNKAAQGRYVPGRRYRLTGKPSNAGVSELELPSLQNFNDFKNDRIKEGKSEFILNMFTKEAREEKHVDITLDFVG